MELTVYSLKRSKPRSRSQGLGLYNFTFESLDKLELITSGRTDFIDVEGGVKKETTSFFRVKESSGKVRSSYFVFSVF